MVGSDRSEILTVSQLNERARDVLESGFPHVLVEGEISNLRNPSSGHTYFTLKDAKAQVRAVMFRFQTRYLRFAPEDGMAVICRGRLTLYEARGDYQIVLDYMEPRGKGALQAAFEQLKARLAEEGLFDPECKRPIPRFPQRVALITSPTGAAVHDMIRIMTGRFPLTGILVIPVRVQGEGAANEIAEAIGTVNREKLAEVIVVGRGGGSLEDLWAFNEEKTARAVASSRIPVISAVGHEVDFTISDFVADIRAPTPTAAANIVVPDQAELIRDVVELGKDLGASMESVIEELGTRVERLSERMPDPRRRIEPLMQRVDEINGRARRAVENRFHLTGERLTGLGERLLALHPLKKTSAMRSDLEVRRQRLIGAMRAGMDGRRFALASASSKLEALSPLGVLARGYSIARHGATGAIVRNSSQTRIGDRVDIRLHRGEISCEVLSRNDAKPDENLD